MKQPITSLPACPVETTLTLLSNRWRAMILRDLLDGTMRFNELRRSVTGISQKVLTSNLREMEDTGLVHREVFAEVPPRVEYSLTPLGQSMRPILDAMGGMGRALPAAGCQGDRLAPVSTLRRRPRPVSFGFMALRAAKPAPKRGKTKARMFCGTSRIPSAGTHVAGIHPARTASLRGPHQQHCLQNRVQAPARTPAHRTATGPAGSASRRSKACRRSARPSA